MLCAVPSLKKIKSVRLSTVNDLVKLTNDGLQSLFLSLISVGYSVKLKAVFCFVFSTLTDYTTLSPLVKCAIQIKISSVIISSHASYRETGAASHLAASERDFATRTPAPRFRSGRWLAA